MKPEPAIQIIDKMLALLSSEDKWTKERFARNRADESVSIDDPTAYKFCMGGAYLKALKDISVDSGGAFKFSNIRIVALNDDPKTTYADVVEFLNKTKAAWQAEM